MKKILTIIKGFPEELSFKLKIYGIVICVVLLIASISVLVMHVSVTQAITHQLEDRAVSISIDLASRSMDLLLTNNLFGLQNLINDTVANNPDIKYIFIIKNYNIVAHSGGNKMISRELLYANKIKNYDTEPSHNLINIYSEEGKIIDVATPILLDLDGTVRVGLSYDSLDEALKKINTQMLYALVAVMLVSVFIVYRLTKKLTNPIAELVDLTQKVSKGILWQRITNYSNDEIGGLSEAFNLMLDEIESSESEKAIYINNINNRNKELSLLNVISQNFTSVIELKNILNMFVEKLVVEMDLDCIILKVRILDQWEEVRYKSQSIIETFGCGSSEINCEILDIEDKGLMKYTYQLTSKTGEIFGELIICNNSEIEPSLLSSLRILTSQLATAVENFELWNMLKLKEEIRQMLLEKIINSQEEERKRIARELHDETSHLLSSILVELKILSQTDKEQQGETLEKIRDLVQKTIEEVHDLGWQLRPSILDKFGLQVAIERYVKEFKNNNELEVELIINGIINDMSPELETTIYRLIQEALTNIAKHAQAKNVSLIITSTNEYISVVVEDDGIGFDSHKKYYKEPNKEHLGVLGMHERVSLFDGEFDIESTIQGGTIVIAKIPYLQRSRIVED